MNIFFLNAQEWDLHEKLLKLGGRVAMAREGQLWFPGTPQTPKTHQWDPRQNNKKREVSCSKSLFQKRKIKKGGEEEERKKEVEKK